MSIYEIQLSLYAYFINIPRKHITDFIHNIHHNQKSLKKDFGITCIITSHTAIIHTYTHTLTSAV